MHGGLDTCVPSSHSTWLAAHLPGSELRISPAQGHISILTTAAVPALEWIVARTADYYGA